MTAQAPHTPLANEMADMAVGDEIAYGDMTFLKVPFGWVFTRFSKLGEPVTTCFIPNMAPPQNKKKPMIIPVN
jgi:hypothetical protein